jgi:hypothetical protein
MYMTPLSRPRAIACSLEQETHLHEDISKIHEQEPPLSFGKNICYFFAQAGAGVTVIV